MVKIALDFYKKKGSFPKFSIWNLNETVSGMLLIIQLRVIFGAPFTFNIQLAQAENASGLFSS